MTESTLLYRQIHPAWVREGRVTSQAFRPTAKDRKRLSVHDGDQISAEESWRRHTLKYRSAGVQAVTVAECRPLPVRPDPRPFPEHVVIDFTGCSRSETRRAAQRLAAAARQRGWAYWPAS